MSAIAKPFIHPQNTIDGLGDMVNVEEAFTATKVVAPSPAGVNSEDQFLIVFPMRNGSNLPKEITWRYVDEATLDTDLAAIKALISAAI